MRAPHDALIEPTPEELESIRAQLRTIEQALSALFGADYRRGPESQRSRRAAADIIERHFERIVEEWVAAIRGMFDEGSVPHNRQVPQNCANALIRFIENLRDRDNLDTYVYLRRHCQEGMLSRVRPSEFNVLHIALKQIIIKRVRSALKRPRMERVREAVVAAIDERRLMVSQFYIESREHELRASEERYRTTIDHAPDPMYEIEPYTWIVQGANAAAEAMYRIVKDHEDKPLVGRRLTELGPPEDIPHILSHVEKVVRDGSDQIRDWPEAGRYFDVNSALISFGKERFIHMILHDVTQRREMLDELLQAPSGWPRPAPSPPAWRTRSTIRSPRSPRWCSRCCRRRRTPRGAPRCTRSSRRSRASRPRSRIWSISRGPRRRSAAASISTTW